MGDLSLHLTTARHFILGRQGLWPGRCFQQFLSAPSIDLSAIKTPKAEAKLARLLKMQFGKKEVTHITYQVAGGEDH